MDEFKSFNLDSVNEESFAIEEPTFVSTLGNFSEKQEKVILFGRSKLMLLLNLLLLVGFVVGFISILSFFGTDLTIVSGDISTSFNWLKFLLVVVLFLSSLMPLGVTMITIGSKTLDVNKIKFGLSLINTLLGISFVILIVAAVISGIGLLMLIFRAFIIVVLLGALVFGLFYVYFKFIKKTMEFVDGVESVFDSHIKSDVFIPPAVSLRPYLIAYGVITILNKLFSSNDNVDALAGENQELFEALTNLDVASNIQFFVSLAVLVLVIYMLSIFDTAIYVRRPARKKPINPAQQYTYREREY